MSGSQVYRRVIYHEQRRRASRRYYCERVVAA